MSMCQYRSGTFLCGCGEGESVIITEININDPASLFMMILVIKISRAECKAAVVFTTPAWLVLAFYMLNLNRIAGLLAFHIYVFPLVGWLALFSIPPNPLLS